MHILSNPLGKRGLFERMLLDVMIEGEVAKVELFPDKTSVPFVQEAGRLTVDVRGLKVDPVDTILRVVMRK